MCFQKYTFDFNILYLSIPIRCNPYWVCVKLIVDLTKCPTVRSNKQMSRAILESVWLDIPKQQFHSTSEPCRRLEKGWKLKVRSIRMVIGEIRTVPKSLVLRLIHVSFWKCHHQCYLSSLYDYDNIKKIRIKGKILKMLIRRRTLICQKISPLRRDVELFMRLSISSDNHYKTSAW